MSGSIPYVSARFGPYYGRMSKSPSRNGATRAVLAAVLLAAAGLMAAGCDTPGEGGVSGVGIEGEARRVRGATVVEPVETPSTRNVEPEQVAEGVREVEVRGKVEGPDASSRTPQRRRTDEEGEEGVVVSPGLRVHLAEGYIDMDAVTLHKHADWLELLVCLDGGREYESVFETQVEPSRVHAALLMLGLEPGHPRRVIPPADPTDPAGEYTAVPPEGPPVRVTVLIPNDPADPAGGTTEVEANRFVMNEQTGEVMDGNVWVFAGSRMRATEGGEGKTYVADANGTLLSLVSFGDDLLARTNTLTNDDNGLTWSTNPDVIPEERTPVVIRLRPGDP